MKMNKLFLIAFVACAIVAGGCHQPKTPIIVQAGSAGAGTEFKPNVPAGFPIAVSLDANKLKQLYASRQFGNRTDPFAMLAIERAFDASQASARFQEQEGWRMDFTPPEEEVQIEVDEVQPYRRLAGILQSDTVTALIIMEDGRAELIWPGRQIPNSEWTVVSIDEERAVLRRSGNKRPNVIEVRLETDPRGMGGGGSAPQGGNQGNNQGGERGGGPGGDERGGRGGNRGGGAG